jgi:hypothetical protein
MEGQRVSPKAALSRRTPGRYRVRKAEGVFWPLSIRIGIVVAATALAAAQPRLAAQTAAPTGRPPARAPAQASKSLAEALPPQKWKRVEDAVDRALAWLVTQQNPDGSFQSTDPAQPGVTSLAVLAFLSRGHQPGHGPYGEAMNRGIDFVISCQKPDGLLCYDTPSRAFQPAGASKTGSYNHAIAGVMLGEIYGDVSGARALAVKRAIEKALRFTRQFQLRPKSFEDRGGWRYLARATASTADSDLSVTAWQLMFLRSAKNAEFSVPGASIEEAMAYVHRCWDPSSGTFNYTSNGMEDFGPSRGMVGAGILSLSLAGQHQTEIALTAGNWLLANPYRAVGEHVGSRDRFFYGAYYCSQAMAQLGGRFWEGWFPQFVDVLLGGQSSEGSWAADFAGAEAHYGESYTTAMAVLSLTPPYQLLPVYQR